jgi:hypothetical protein
MKKFFHYYYYRYVFNTDPASTWFIHSLKIIMACGLAGVIGLYEKNLAALWLIQPTLLLMLAVNMTQPLKARLQDMIILWLFAFSAVMLLSWSSSIVWLQNVLFLGSAFITFYVLSRFPRYTKIGAMLIIYLLVGYGKPIPPAELLEGAYNFVLSLVICISIMLLIFPQTLPYQVKRNVDAILLLLGRYIYLVISDAVRGNYAVEMKQVMYEKLLAMVINIELLDAALKKSYYRKKYDSRVPQLRKTIYQAIALENTFQNLSRQNFLYVTTHELESLARHILDAFLRKTTDSLEQLQTMEQAFSKYLNIMDEQINIIRQNNPLGVHGLMQWGQINYLLESLLVQIRFLLKQERAE